MNIENLLKRKISQSQLLSHYICNVRYITISDKINGFVFRYKGINNIFVNRILPNYKRRLTILHELAHIEISILNNEKENIVYFYKNKCFDETDLYIKKILSKIESC